MSDREQFAASVALPASPPTSTQDMPNLLAQATAVHDVDRSATDDDEANESIDLHDGDNDTRDATNGHVNGAGQYGEVGSPHGEDAQTPGKDTFTTSNPSNRSKVLPLPNGEDEEATTPVPPTPSTKRPPTRTDSLRSSTSPSIASPRGAPAALALASEPSTGSQGRDSSSVASPTPASAGGATTHRRSLTMSKGRTVSAVLISSALEIIANSKEGKRTGPLKDSVQHALELVRAGEGGDKPREIFEPLRLACETKNERLLVASLDCISKLISYSFFLESSPDGHHLASPPVSPGQAAGASQESIMEPSLVDAVVHTITSCHAENTPDPVSLQIVKSLLALILSNTLLVHQSSLLKAVRTVYNVFLLSNDPVTQNVAQGGLTQMVHHVFTRCHIDQREEDEEGHVFPLNRDSNSSLNSAYGAPQHATPLTPPAEPASISTLSSDPQIRVNDDDDEHTEYV
jgi:brefeldin A-inhibited guanine nucleotide-exchange protein